jgi:hypothetical protein
MKFPPPLAGTLALDAFYLSAQSHDFRLDDCQGQILVGARHGNLPRQPFGFRQRFRCLSKPLVLV